MRRGQPLWNPGPVTRSRGTVLGLEFVPRMSSRDGAGRSQAEASDRPASAAARRRGQQPGRGDQGGGSGWLMPRWAAWRCRYNAGVEGWCARPWTQYLSAGKIATWLSKMTLQAIASVRVHDEFQRGSAGEARSRASAAVVIQLGGVRRHVGPRPLPPDGRDRHHRRCE
jgi:hypothetical protein